VNSSSHRMCRDDPGGLAHQFQPLRTLTKMGGNMKGNWVKADAWHRREIGDGTYLAVSLHAKGRWQWRRHIRATGAVMASGSGVTAPSAMINADKAIAETYTGVAA
jgi:hypothetical protein